MLRDEELMNAILGKIFNAIAMSDAFMGSPSTGRHFVSFTSPGIPVSTTDLDFATPTTQRQIEAASAFADLANSIQDVKGFWHTSANKLWDEYKRVLTQAVLPLTVLSAAEQQQLIDATSLLWINGQETSLFRRYQQNAEEYFNAQLTYNSMLVAVQSNQDNADLVGKWVVNEPVYRSQIQTANQKWIAAGKNQVEVALALIDRLAARDPFLVWSQYKQLFEASLRTDFQSQQFYTTGFTPQQLWEATSGWTPFIMEGHEVGSVDLSDRNFWGGGFGANDKLWSFSTSQNLANRNGIQRKSSQAVNFEVSLQYKRVPLLRSWLVPSVFASRAWKWERDSIGLLSDGLLRSQGTLPAYPSQVIVVKDLQIQIDLSSGDDAQAVDLFDQYSMIGWGPFRLRGGNLLQEFRPSIAGIFDPSPPPIDLTPVIYKSSPITSIDNFNYRTFVIDTGRIIDSHTGNIIDRLINPDTGHEIGPLIGGIVNNRFMDPLRSQVIDLGTGRVTDFNTGHLINRVSIPGPGFPFPPRVPSAFGRIIEPDTRTVIDLVSEHRIVVPSETIGDLNDRLRYYNLFERTFPVQPLDFVASSTEIRAPGLQIIGFVCEMLPRSPNPDSSLQWP